jgi:predicted nucleotidyltransferase
VAEIYLDAAQLSMLKRILFIHLPPGAHASVFGSRATGRNLKRHSDVDVLIDAPFELPLATMADLREALDESDLACRVDVIQRSQTEPAFVAALEERGIAALPLEG